ncbi:MAG TPA: hypothetical protein EYQ29_09455, partial [Candidatus Lambdaproteobacteria bacterium]|nr:hypothetical protein [Candidatus Lambdaproteobacteria bacterium]
SSENQLGWSGDNPDSKPGYCALVVDETQDLGTQALKLLRAMIPEGANDLFFVGDGYQRIYGRNRAVMGKCGINIRGRSRKLYLNYRTTDEIRKYAVNLLEGRALDDLDGELDENKRYKSLSHGPEPIIENVHNLEQTGETIQKILNLWNQEGTENSALGTCIMAHSRVNRDSLQQKLSSEHQCLVLEAGTRDTSKPDVLRFSTMHRAKGLEFEQVVVVVSASFLDADNDSNHLNLLHVAMTRARRHAALLVVE